MTQTLALTRRLQQSPPQALEKLPLQEIEMVQLAQMVTKMSPLYLVLHVLQCGRLNSRNSLTSSHTA